MEIKLFKLLRALNVLASVKDGVIFANSSRLYVKDGSFYGESFNKSSSTFIKVLIDKVESSVKFKEVLLDNSKILKVLNTFNPDSSITIENGTRCIVVKGNFEVKLGVFGISSNIQSFSNDETNSQLGVFKNPLSKDDLSVLKKYSGFTTGERPGDTTEHPKVVVFKKMRVTDMVSMRSYSKDFNFPYPLFFGKELIEIISTLNQEDYTITFYDSRVMLSDSHTWVLVGRDRQAESKWVKSVESNLPNRIEEGVTETITINKEEYLQALKAISSMHSSHEGEVEVDFNNQKLLTRNTEDTLDVPLKMELSSPLESRKFSLRKLKAYVDFYGDSMVLYSGQDSGSPLYFENDVESCCLTRVG